MTFSIVARDPATGQFGAAVTTSSPAVGSRCPYVASGIGAVLTQHRTDPRLGPLVLDLLRRGFTARQAVDAVVAGAPGIGWRQLACVDRDGRTAVFHGDRIYSVFGHAEGEGCVALGNILASERVPAAMVAGYREHGGSLAARLVAALAAGSAAGGETQPVRSAAVLTVGEHDFPLVDLRVDWSDGDPVADLAGLVVRVEPTLPGYVRRALDPESEPVDPEMWARGRREVVQGKARE